MLFLKFFIPVVLLSVADLQNNTAPYRLTDRNSEINQNQDTHKTPAKIQAAIILDVSGSMDGLIDQAKAQLWNMVNVMGQTRCEGMAPDIEIALYEYGRSTNSEKEGYVKQLSGFGTNLDEISQQLFSLTTNGGAEYCGQAIYTSLNELQWDSSSSVYKVIFIAGNEDFLQGNLHYNKACDLARTKSIIVNTIYCGSKEAGIREHWNLAGECGNGTYSNIDHQAKMEEIPTIFDDPLFSLNDQLNKTYIGFGEAAHSKIRNQESADEQNYTASKMAMAKRVEAKSQKNIYNNADWDLVDASMQDSLMYKKVDMKTLPSGMQGMSRKELKQVIDIQTKERLRIQKQIASLSLKRNEYLKAERMKNGKVQNGTLQSEIEKIILLQAKQFQLAIPASSSIGTVEHGD